MILDFLSEKSKSIIYTIFTFFLYKNNNKSLTQLRALTKLAGK